MLRDTKLAGQLLSHVHRIVSLVKRWWARTHQGATSARHLSCLDELSFRFNRRKSRSRAKLFYRLVQQAAFIESAPYHSTVGGNLRQQDP